MVNSRSDFPSRRSLYSLLDFDFSITDWRDAFRAALVTAIVATIPVVQGHPELAVPLSIGAVFAAVSEAGQPFGTRWRTMLWTTAALMGAAFLGQSLSDSTLLAILVTAPVAFLAGSIGSFGKRAAVGGLLALVLFSIYVGVPVPLQDAPTTALLVGLGGFLQTVATLGVGLARHQHRHQQSTDESATFRWQRKFVVHGVRLAAVMVIATSISESVSLPHPYWLPMSVAWMSRPDRDGTVDRVLHRLTGTIVGLFITGGLALTFGPGTVGFLAISLIGAGIAIAFIWANYAMAVTGVTMWIVAIFAMVGDPVVSTMGIRLGATICAAALVLVGTWLPQILRRSSPPS